MIGGDAQTFDAAGQVTFLLQAPAGVGPLTLTVTDPGSGQSDSVSGLTWALPELTGLDVDATGVDQAGVGEPLPNRLTALGQTGAPIPGFDASGPLRFLHVRVLYSGEADITFAVEGAVVTHTAPGEALVEGAVFDGSGNLTVDVINGYPEPGVLVEATVWSGDVPLATGTSASPLAWTGSGGAE